MTDRHIPIRPYTMKQLAELYGVGLKTLRKWFRPHRDDIGRRNGHFFTTKQIQKIFEHLGPPPDKNTTK